MTKQLKLDPWLSLMLRIREFFDGPLREIEKTGALDWSLYWKGAPEWNIPYLSCETYGCAWGHMAQDETFPEIELELYKGDYLPTLYMDKTLYGHRLRSSIEKIFAQKYGVEFDYIFGDKRCSGGVTRRLEWIGAAITYRTEILAKRAALHDKLTPVAEGIGAILP